jgi:hypothetical protein
MSNMPPVPPGNRSQKGPSSAPGLKTDDRSQAGKKGGQGQGKVKQNTTKQGQQDR